MPGWKILDIVPGSSVDFVGDCTDLSQFASNSIGEVYISHVLEHLGHQGAFENSMGELFRILEPGGIIRIAVPDLKVLCELFLENNAGLGQKLGVVNILYGGQKNDYDFHKSAFDEDLLTHYLKKVGFSNVSRVKSFDFVSDASQFEYAGKHVSLNMEATKPHLQQGWAPPPQNNKADRNMPNLTGAIFGPLFSIPDRFLKDFSMGGRIPITMQFRHETSDGVLTWSKHYWESLQPAIDQLLSSGKPIGYSSDVHMISALNAFPVKGKSVVVIGSVHPLYEAIVHRMGANPTTVEFRKIEHDIPELTTYTVEELKHLDLQFDCGVTISALEHDGLGRYGDPIDPFGDLKTMRSYKNIIRKNGLMFLSVPVGQDATVWNSHRIYGRMRLPMLLEGWKMIGQSGFNESLFDLGKVGEDYKEPVFVLQNI